MSEFERLDDDLELAAFEQVLRATPLPLPAPERDRLLYACGFATGRQAAAPRLRAWIATAAALGIWAGTLATTIWTDRVAAPSVQSAQLLKATRENHPGEPAVGRPESAVDLAHAPPAAAPASRHDSHILTAGMSLDEALRLLERAPEPVEPREHSQEPPAAPVRPYSKFTP